VIADNWVQQSDGATGGRNRVVYQVGTVELNPKSVGVATENSRKPLGLGGDRLFNSFTSLQYCVATTSGLCHCCWHRSPCVLNSTEFGPSIDQCHPNRSISATASSERKSCSSTTSTTVKGNEIAPSTCFNRRRGVLRICAVALCDFCSLYLLPPCNVVNSTNSIFSRHGCRSTDR
jgi:hypothetical protein